ncbi:MAG: hypothetical protein JNK51_10295 [Blastocatellia bacterium]|nr:hypothetical protein [Blastocatellia bacterium]
MPEQSFTITLANNRTEKVGIEYLTANTTGYFYVDNVTRKRILELLGMPAKYVRAFDMVFIPRFEGQALTEQFIETHIDEITLIELKVTRKYLPENPKGFFFGATQNEFDFGQLLGDKFRFCFVSLHERGSSHVLLTIAELEAIIRTRRIQYQINL